MGASVLTEHAANGGFPEPPRGLALRVVEASHACGARTRVTIPAVLAASAVRRLRCGGCGERYETEDVIEVRGLRPTALSLERLSVPGFDPSSRGWQVASGLIAGALVVGGLALIQGGDDGAETPRAPATEGPAVKSPTVERGEARPESRDRGGEPVAADVIRGTHYSLALPRGWEKIQPPVGATFAASVPGEAEATLWIEEDPELGFPAFIDQSLRQLQTLVPNPKVVSRTPGPTPESTVVRLAADPLPDQPVYEVLLRAAGPYRYYLALTTYPDASSKTSDELALLANSLTPEIEG